MPPLPIVRIGVPLVALGLIVLGCELGTSDEELQADGGAVGGASVEGRTWSTHTHPCSGNRTDALWCDTADRCWTGCGTTTAGDQGLWETTDGGRTWERPRLIPSDALARARVNDLSRSADGALYVAGDLPGRDGVVRILPSGEVEPVWTRGTEVDFSFPVGRFRRDARGFAIAESLTGTGLVFRTSDDAAWQSGAYFWDRGDEDDVPSGVQILGLAEHGGRFFGAGSTISQPPMVFVSDWEPGVRALEAPGPDAIAPFNFRIVTLGTGFRGELWDVAADADGAVAGGVDQEANVGVIYTWDGSGNPATAEAWQEFRLSSLYPDNTTWIQGVCRGGGAVYAVGRESRQRWGIVLRSTDGGRTFTELAPSGSGQARTSFDEIYRCAVLDGALVVAGRNGFFARWSRP